MISLQLTVISYEDRLERGMYFMFPPAHSEIIHFFERKATGMCEIIKPQ